MKLRALILVFVLLTALALFLLLLKTGDIPRTTDNKELSITTEHIEILPSHEHLAGNSNAEHGKRIFSPIISVPEDLWIRGFSAEVENAPSALLHHAMLVRSDKPDPICPELWSPKGFAYLLWAASSSETTQTTSLPSPYAIFLPKGSQLALNVMLHNPASPYGPGGEYRNVSVRITLNVEPVDQQNQYQPVETYRLRLADKPCQVPDKINLLFLDTFKVPSETTFFRKIADIPVRDSGRLRFSRSGRVVTILEHLHPRDGGRNLQVLVNDRVVSEARTDQFGQSPWQIMTKQSGTTNIHIEQGDEIALAAEYTNPYPQTVPDAMGMAVIYFSPED